MSTEDRLDRASNPELSGLFDAFDGLVHAPADPALRTEQIERAALLARASGVAASTTGWHLRRAAAWRVAAAAAAVLAVFAGLGADDRLPAPAQRVASSIAGMVGIELPDASERHDSVEPHEHRGTSGRSSTVPAEPAEPGDPGEPADPATPAEPDGGESGSEPSTPATETTPTTPGTQGTTEPIEPDQPEKSEKTSPTTPTSPTPPTPPTTPTTAARDDRRPTENPSTTVATGPQNEPEKRQNQSGSTNPDESGTPAE